MVSGTVVPFFEPSFGFWEIRSSVFCTLVPVLGVQGTSAKTTLLETTLLLTPDLLQRPPGTSSVFRKDALVQNLRTDNACRQQTRADGDTLVLP